MDDRVKIADLKVKDELENTYFVKYIQVMESRDGKNYLNVILGDSTGDLEGRVWQKAREIADRVEKGNYVKAKGRVNLFQGRKQFIISKIESVDEAEINPSDYISTSEESPDLMFTRLTEIITGLKDVYIRELLIAVINDQEIARRLKTWQAGKTIHHAYQSGLLEHILSCCELGLTLSPIYKVNTSYVIAGCFLHDLCKIYELTDGANVEYTEEGKLVGHLVKSLEIVDRFSYRIPNFPYKLKLHLKHILLSHHGQYEYGSPKIPQTSEAMLVHMIDLMDSKMATFETIKKKDNQSGNWSSFVKHLDRIVYKEELPTYDAFIDDTQTDTKPVEVTTNNEVKKPTEVKNTIEIKKAKTVTRDKDLKQNLGSLLKDFNPAKD